MPGRPPSERPWPWAQPSWPEPWPVPSPPCRRSRPWSCSRRSSTPRRPWGQPSSQEPCRQQPSRVPSWQLSPWGPSPPPRRRPSSQPSRPLVDLLNLHEVGDGLDVTARLRVVGTDDGVADPLKTEAAQRVTLVLLLAHLGLRLCDLQSSGHQAPTFAAAAASASARTRRAGAT